MFRDNRPLLCRSALLPGEWLPSLLVRLSARNHYPRLLTVKELAQERLVEVDNIELPSKAVTFEQINSLVKIPVNELYRATAHLFGAIFTPPEVESRTITLPTGDQLPLLAFEIAQEQVWPNNNVCYCPHCLQESAYHRLAWVPLAVSVCLKHKCLLVRGCPACKSRIRVEDTVQAKCPACSFALGEASTISIVDDTAGLTAQHWIHQWLGLLADIDQSSSSSLAGEAPAALYRFLDGVRRAIMLIKLPWSFTHSYSNLPTPKWTGVTKSNLTPIQLYTAYTTAFRCLIDWPVGFYEFLDAYRLRDNRQISGQLAKDLGAVYGQWLEKNWRFPQFQFVQAAFDDYVLDRYTISPSIIRLRRFRDDPRFSSKFMYITQAEAASLLKTTPKIIQRLVEKELLNGFNRDGKQVPPNRFRLVDFASVNELQKQWQETFPLETVAQLLGLSDEVTLDLVKVQLLTATRGPDVDGSSTWQISRQSVANLMDCLEQKLIHWYDKNMSAMTLTKAAQTLSRYGYDAAALIKLIVEGRIRGYWGQHGRERFCELYVAAREIQAHLDELRENRPFVTQHDIAQMMGVKTTTVGRWAKHGLLKQDRKQGVAWYFSREDAEQFIAEHIFTEEAAQILGVGELVVCKWVRNKRLRPVSGPGVDDGHRYLFRRKDIERFKPENRLTAPQMAEILGISRSQLVEWIKQGKVKPLSGPGIDDSGHYLFVRPREDALDRFRPAKGSS